VRNSLVFQVSTICALSSVKELPTKIYLALSIGTITRTWWGKIICTELFTRKNVENFPARNRAPRAE
jgi:hypothetical protein